MSYLECKINAGSSIDQNLLDLTINAVRGRSSVQMPAVTETDPAKLMQILKRERRVELAWEGLRYWDLLRWDETSVLDNKPMYGIFLTNNPENSTRVSGWPHWALFCN